MHLEEFQIIKSKDIANYLNISESTAKRLYRDVKREYNLKFVLLYHLKTYLKI